ncbi:urease accessory protein UreD [Streptomyces rochei]|uniref:urease accessory protein UreD n=1 Tax=Streptomyces rochei TaxID=1928 RepID=UPI0036C2ADB0
MIAGARPSARGSTASLHWLPEPLISTQGSVLHQTFTVDLAPTSRLLMREEQLLGRSGEAPGHLTTRLTVRRGGRPLLDQHSAYGHPAPARDGPPSSGATGRPDSSSWSIQDWTHRRSRTSSATARQRDTPY